MGKGMGMNMEMRGERGETMPLVRKVGGSLPISGCSNRAPAALVWGSWGKDKEEEEE